jgi:thioesterase domain-containing protein
MNPRITVNYSNDLLPEVGWRKFVDGELEIYEVPGSHTGILEEPNVQVLAEKLKVCIDKALTETKGEQGQKSEILPTEKWLELNNLSNLSNRLEPPQSSLVPIQTTGVKPPFFFVNSISNAQILGSFLGSDQPFYCLHIFGLTEFFQNQLSHLRIEDIAAKFIEDMRLIQPDGPYFLVTYCADSCLTFEMAQQLHAQGQEIALLAFIDTIWKPVNLGNYKHWYNLRQFGLNYILEKAKNKLKFTKDRLIIHLNQSRGKISVRTWTTIVSLSPGH